MIPIAISTIADDDDREFMANLYMEFRWLMFSEIKKIICDVTISEDIMQDVIIKLIDKLDILKSLEQRQQVSYIATAARSGQKLFEECSKSSTVLG